MACLALWQDLVPVTQSTYGNPASKITYSVVFIVVCVSRIQSASQIYFSQSDHGRSSFVSGIDRQILTPLYPNVDGRLSYAFNASLAVLNPASMIVVPSTRQRDCNTKVGFGLLTWFSFFMFAIHASRRRVRHSTP
jgi:hypothetical protein